MNALVNNEFFSISSQLYVRLRRVTGRVIDAIYMGQNQDYARHVIQLALATDDIELQRYATCLHDFLEPEVLNLQENLQENVQQETLDMGTASLDDSGEHENTPEEIYKAEISHHYIGALR